MNSRQRPDKEEARFETKSSLGRAFYAASPGGWRDYFNLLHLPYTLWHLSYVAIGAAFAEDLYIERLGGCLLAFFLAVGIGAHALDEMKGRPLQTKVPDSVLFVLGSGSIFIAVLIGLFATAKLGTLFLLFIFFGIFIVYAYNLELFRGRFHSDFWFAVSWGIFPMVTSYWVNSLQFRPLVVPLALFCFLTSLGQRYLSREARFLRRKVAGIDGKVELATGEERGISQEYMILTYERPLKLLSAAIVSLAIALIAAHDSLS